MMTNTARSTTVGPTTGWMIGWSLWMLLVLLPGGVTTWLGFILVGLFGRNGRWTLSGVAYAVVAIVLSLELWEAWDIVLLGAFYVVSIVHALTVNPRWLALLWGRRERGESFAGVRSASATANRSSGSSANRAARGSSSSRKQAKAPAEAEELLSGPGTDRSDYLADAPASGSSSVPSGSSGSSRSSRSARSTRERDRSQERRGRTSSRSSSPNTEPDTAAEPVDVNTASQRELARLPGMDRRSAKAAVKARTERGGFASVDDFARTAGLQPHELARLRDRAVCSPRPRAARSFGRRLDL